MEINGLNVKKNHKKVVSLHRNHNTTPLMPIL